MGRKVSNKKNKYIYSLDRYQILGILIVGILLGMFFVNNLFNEKNTTEISLEEFWTVWSELEENYVYEIEVGEGEQDEEDDKDPLPTDEEKVWGAIKGLTRSYNDPYTTFLIPKENKKFRSNVIKSKFEGVGIYIDTFDDYIIVVSPLNETPAAKAGIMAKDIILEIDGESTKGISTSEAADLIRGEKGTTVILNVKREGEKPFDISVVRGTINIPTVETSIEDEIFIINLRNFSAPSFFEFKKALGEFNESEIENLVIDIRNNHGGLLDSSVEIASFFIPFKERVLSQSLEKGIWKTHLSKGYDELEDKEYKLAILVNSGTASSSEILAGAIQFHKKGIVVGTQTFGKGSVQELIPITEDTSLKVTISHWRDASGEFITGRGIEPDVIAEGNIDTEDDEVLERAKNILKNNYEEIINEI